MAQGSRVFQTSQGWFVETEAGRFGPMDSEQEAASYLSLMIKVDVAGCETACIDVECDH